MMRYDLVIVGGGLVGAGLAVALRGMGLRIALVDARLPDSNDPRLFGLNLGSCHFLNHVGIWPALQPYASPIHEVHVSRRGYFGAVHLRREDASLSMLGHVVPACHIEAALNEMLHTLPELTLYRPAVLQSLQQEKDEAVLRLKSEAGEVILSAPIVIGADGTISTVREQAGIGAETVDYKQSAIVTRTKLRRSHHAIAYERFTADGAVAMLPLAERECATIWTAGSDFITSLMSLSDETFLQRLQLAFGYRLGRFEKIGARHWFPLKMVRANSMTSGSVMLLGNAAHTVHPIAAQGFNLALYEVAVFVEYMREKLAGQSMVSASDLAKIESRILKQQAVSIGTSHRLAQIFKNQSSWLYGLTQLGMVGVDAVRPLKEKMINGILGRTGNVPSLLLDANG